MYIHIGNSKVVFNDELIGIFNFSSSDNQVNHKILKNASFEAINNTAGNDCPRSFVVTNTDVFVSPISTLTLSKRYNSKE